MPLDADHNSKTFHVVGHRNTRPDGVDKVTGRAKYGADMTAPGMLHAKILRSPHAHAKILKIDTSKAEALPGVKAVVTSADFKDHPDVLADSELTNVRYNVMAREKALYDGHAVAAVAATNPRIANKALKLTGRDGWS